MKKTLFDDRTKDILTVCSISVLSAYDGIATQAGLTAGRLKELNPILQSAFETGCFLFVKFFIAACFLLLLTPAMKVPLTRCRVLFRLLLALHVGIAAIHLYNMP